MTEEVGESLSQPEPPATGVYEAKFDRAQAAVTQGGYLTAYPISEILKGVHLDDDGSRPVIDAMKYGLTEAQIATQAKLGKEVDSAEGIQALRVAGSAALNHDIKKLRRVSKAPVAPNANPAPFMVDAVAKEFACGKEEAAAKIVVALDDAQAALMRDSEYPNPKAEGKRQPKMLTDFLVLGDAEMIGGKIKDQFIANCGVQVSKGVVDKATAQPAAHQQEGELIPLVAEVAMDQQKRRA